jgi:hypothetical protein
MDKNTLIAALASGNIAPDSWISVPELLYVSLSTDANQYHNFLSQLLHFDTTNEILKIKEYYYTLVGCRFSSYEKIGESQFRLGRSEIGNYGLSEVKDLGQMREPIVGDFVYTVTSSEQVSEIATLVSFSNGVMTLSADLDVTDKKLCYAQGDKLKLLAGSLSPKREGDRLELFLSRSSILILKRPMSGYEADVYVSTLEIEGFSYRRFGTSEDFIIKERY